ncbi:MULTISPECIES: hypothetical protein [Bacillus]|uniref:hypothetical protein n=1 Tax=Bacillus TaxID=1386 RepID=UPI00083E177A|nr:MULTISPECIES: hypothetical protein [Bacillus]MBT9285887.1 hypothetical protein [Bacillus velezensis]MCX2820239.1 hypothetical protein [Bacillus sp. H1F1]MED3231503.1 hypothetical protein [Bacillus velezensis]MED3334673.1 hypothetical protein [Bacillus velezensis]MED3511829.1 hypothetical protein [Bacillus velezensis]
MINEPTNNQIRTMVLRKYAKLLASCERSLRSIDNGEIRMAIGDLDFVKDNLEEIQYILRDVVNQHEYIEDKNKM